MLHMRRDYQDRIQDEQQLIPDDEPVMLIRGQDIAAIPALDAWIAASIENGVDKDLIDSAYRHRDRIAAWQVDQRVKVADCDKALLR